MTRLHGKRLRRLGLKDTPNNPQASEIQTDPIWDLASSPRLTMGFFRESLGEMAESLQKQIQKQPLALLSILPFDKVARQYCVMLPVKGQDLFRGQWPDCWSVP